MLKQGNNFIDNRGKLLFNNKLNLSAVKRMYIIENSSIDIIRAWQTHKIEKRWFVAVEGQFEIKLVKIDSFENPSDNLDVKIFTLDGNTLDSLEIKPGYATSIQAVVENSKLLVFSDYMLGEVEDDYKYDSYKWK